MKWLIIINDQWIQTWIGIYTCISKTNITGYYPTLLRSTTLLSRNYFDYIFKKKIIILYFHFNLRILYIVYRYSKMMTSPFFFIGGQRDLDKRNGAVRLMAISLSQLSTGFSSKKKRSKIPKLKKKRNSQSRY